MAPSEPAIPLPEGVQLLETEEAIYKIVAGDHPEAGEGSIEQDAFLARALRAGWIVAIQFDDGRIAFTPTKLGMEAMR